MNKNHRIIWSSKASGTDETTYIGSLVDARKAAKKMIGQDVLFSGEVIGVVQNAYVADEEGNEI